MTEIVLLGNKTAECCGLELSKGDKVIFNSMWSKKKAMITVNGGTHKIHLNPKSYGLPEFKAGS